jgi:transcriptional regulator with XRE-family HTH domain
MQMDVGNRIKSERVRRQLSVAALARASGLTKGFISQVENGYSRPSLASLQRIAAALNTSVTLLVGEPSLDLSPGRDHLPVRVANGALADAPDSTSALGAVTIVQEEFEGVVALIHLPPETVLRSPTVSTHTTQARATCLVHDGNVSFVQEERSIELGPGDALSWSGGISYALENDEPSTATLLLLVPRHWTFPTLVPHPQSTGHTLRRAQGSHKEGPFRLVAMRAARVAARGSSG